MLKNSIKSIFKNFIPISVGIICLYALFLRIMFLRGHTLWTDELYQLDHMKGTFLEFLKVVPKVEVNSYLNGDLYLIYPFFKIFSYNKWGLAIPHIAITILGFYILYLICKRYFKSALGYFITFGIVCFNATLINHATEIRPYAVLPTLSLVMVYLFQRISDLNFNLTTAKKIGAIISLVLIIWFHFYGILMFFCAFLFILFSKYKEKDFKVYCKKSISFALIVLCFAMPLWLYSLLPYMGHTEPTVTTFDYIPNPASNMLGFLKAVFCNLVGSKKLYFLFLGIIIPFIFSYQDRYKQLFFLFFNVISPISIILFLDMLRSYWFLQRQFIWVMPLFAFFLGWAWDSLYILLKLKKKYKKEE